MAAREKTINAEIETLNDLRTKAYGSSGATGELRPSPARSNTPLDAGKAAQVACQQIGKKYVWAAEGPNTFDCSGLTLYAWAQARPESRCATTPSGSMRTRNASAEPT